MKLPRKLEVILMGILFAMMPALLIGLIVYLASGNWPVTLFVFSGLFGLGLDINFRGRK